MMTEENPHGLPYGLYSVCRILFSKNEKFAEKVICHHDQKLHQDLGNLIVHVDHRDQQRHESHIHEQCCDTGTEERQRLLKDMSVLAFKDVFSISKIGESHGKNPGNHIGNLELHWTAGIQKGQNTEIIGHEADNGGQASYNEIIDDFLIFRVQCFQLINHKFFFLFSDSYEYTGNQRKMPLQFTQNPQ